MLTKDDLIQIKNIVRGETEPLAKDLNSVRLDLNVVKEDLRDVKKRVRKLEKTVDVAIKIFDESDVKLGKRVGKIEVHLGLPSKN